MVLSPFLDSQKRGTLRPGSELAQGSNTLELPSIQEKQKEVLILLVLLVFSNLLVRHIALLVLVLVLILLAVSLALTQLLLNPPQNRNPIGLPLRIQRNIPLRKPPYTFPTILGSFYQRRNQQSDHRDPKRCVHVAMLLGRTPERTGTKRPEYVVFDQVLVHLQPPGGVKDISVITPDGGILMHRLDICGEGDFFLGVMKEGAVDPARGRVETEGLFGDYRCGDAIHLLVELVAGWVVEEFE